MGLSVYSFHLQTANFFIPLECVISAAPPFWQYRCELPPMYIDTGLGLERPFYTVGSKSIVFMNINFLLDPS